MFQIHSQATLEILLPCEAPRSRLRLLQHARELGSVEVALVEQAFGRLDDGGDDPQPRDDTAHRADGSLTCAFCDLADLELELRPTRQASRRLSIGVEPACAAWPE
jgi:hypothetical protein